MTHATITAHTSTVAVVEFVYDEATKNAVKALPGSSYDGDFWLVAIMHLPTLRGIFDTMTVEPTVIVAYHTLLKRMLCDLLGQEGSEDAQLLTRKHANGIAAILATGWRPLKVERPHYVAPQPIAGPVEAKDAGLAVWLTGVKNAAKAEETQKHIANARRRKAKANA